MQKLKCEEGKCPNCGNDIIDYSNAEFDDGHMVHYNCRCITCGYEFEEWFEFAH